MKKPNVNFLFISFLLSSFLFLLSFQNVYCQLNMDCDGKVSVGNTTPNTYTFKVEGTSKITAGTAGGVIFDNSGYSSNPAVYGGANLGKTNSCWYVLYATHWYTTSDKRQKENIKKLNSSLELIMQLDGVKYDYIKESVILNSIRNSVNDEKLENARKNHVGFIAQDVEKVIPEVVSYDETADIYGIDLSRLTPYLVEAIKEQQEIIGDLKEELEDLKKQFESEGLLKSSSISTNHNDLQVEIDNTLYQNAPNPFSANTSIKYYLTKEVQTAMLNIYDMNGAQLKSIPLIQKGNGEFTISSGEFKSGMYMYSLIADGKVIDTKRMILTD